jgi:gas vesicle protein
MDSLLIAPRNKKELRLISDVLKKMGIASKSLTLEEKEDIGLGMAMKEVDRSKKVSANLILQKLRV